MKLTVILPAYNEEENVQNLVEMWQKVIPKISKYTVNIVFVEDGSSDNTKIKIYEQMKKYSNVSIVEHEKNKGLNKALNTGIEYFLSNSEENDLMLLMDSDCTHLPSDSLEMLTKINEGADVVIASRYAKGATVQGVPSNRLVLTGGAKLLYKLLLNVKGVKDYTCGYRIYTKNILKRAKERYKDKLITAHGFECMMELIYKLAEVGANIKESPIHLEYDKKGGTSKMNIFKTVKNSFKMCLNLRKIDILKTLIFLLLSVYICLQSINIPINTGNEYLGDQGIYAYMGQLIEDGKVIYKDGFDNKGPLLYFIYYIQLLLGNKYGFFFVEILCVLVTFILSDKILKKFSSNTMLNVIANIYSTMFYIVTFSRGGSVELYAIPIILLAINSMINYFKENYTKTDLLTIGATFSSLILLRPNLATMHVAFAIVVILAFIFKKKIKEILQIIPHMLYGVAAVLIPFVIYLLINNALFDCINSAYLNVLSTMKPITKFEIEDCITWMRVYLFDHNVQIIFAIFVLTIIYNLKKKLIKYEINNFILVYTALNLYFVTLSGVMYEHYMMSFIPIILLMAATILVYVQKISENKKFKFISLIVAVIFLMLVKGTLIDQINYTKRTIEFKENINPILVSINQNTLPQDKIQIISGNQNYLYYLADKSAVSKYYYVQLFNRISDEQKKKMLEVVFNDIEKSDAKLIIIEQDKIEEIIKLIGEEKYNNVVNNMYNYLDQKQGHNIYILK